MVPGRWFAAGARRPGLGSLIEMTKMSALIRLILNLTIIVGLTAGLFVLVAACVVQLEPGLGHLPEWYRDYQEAKSKEAEIKRKGRPQLLVFHIKNRVTRELLQGKMTLRQAVGIFRYLHEAPPFDPTIWLPGASREEKYGRNVLESARMEQRCLSTRFSLCVVEHLEAELRELLAGQGGWIPDVNPATIPELSSASR
jgi:hypothetical protein